MSNSLHQNNINDQHDDSVINDESRKYEKNSQDTSDEISPSSESQYEGDSDKGQTSQSSTTQDIDYSTHELLQKISDLEAHIVSITAERDDWKNKAYRSTADLQNLSKQAQLDTQQARKSGKKSVAVPILSFFNTINLALSYAPSIEDPQYQQFLSVLYGSFEQAKRDLESSGIEILVPLVGNEVNPEYMEVVNGISESENETESPTIKQVIGLGLRVDQQLVQSATVSI